MGMISLPRVEGARAHRVLSPSFELNSHGHATHGRSLPPFPARSDNHAFLVRCLGDPDLLLTRSRRAPRLETNRLLAVRIFLANKSRPIRFTPHHQGTELALFTRGFDCRDACD